MLWRTVSLNSTVSWVTTPISERRLPERRSRMSTPSIVDAPGVRVEEARQQVDQGRLAGARRAHQRDDLARPDRQVDLVQHRPVVVGEGDLLVGDAVRDRRERRARPGRSAMSLGIAINRATRWPAAAPPAGSG